MKRLLQESKFAKTWETQREGYDIAYESSMNDLNVYSATFHSSANKHDYISELVFSITLVGDDDYKPNELLCLYIYYDEDKTEKFIRNYEIEPYTYICCICDDSDVSQRIKPFTYEISEYPFVSNPNLDFTTLPICISYTGKHKINSILTVAESEEKEYEIGKMMQNEIKPLPKSARIN